MSFLGRLVLFSVVLCLGQGSSLSRREKRGVISPGLTVDEELKLTVVQKEALTKLRAAVEKNLVAPHMKKDIYLVKFLRNSGFNADAAIKMVDNALKFRDDYDIETLKDAEGVAKFEGKTTDVDNEGRVVLYMQVGKWGLAGAMAGTNGTKTMYENAYYVLFEEAANKVLDGVDKGSKFAQYIMVLDYEQWTTVQGACLTGCIPLVQSISEHYCKNWPGFVHKILLVNTADDFNLFLKIMTPFISTEVGSRLEIFDRRKNIWCPEVGKLVDMFKVRGDCPK